MKQKTQKPKPKFDVKWEDEWFGKTLTDPTKKRKRLFRGRKP